MYFQKLLIIIHILSTQLFLTPDVSKSKSGFWGIIGWKQTAHINEEPQSF